MTLEPGTAVVLDASALLAWLRGEPGADVVDTVLPTSAVSAVNWSETGQKLAQHGVDAGRALRRLQVLGIQVENFTADDALLAAQLWPTTRAAGLSLADRCCLALAVRLDRPAVTADVAWTRAPGVEVAIELIR